MGWNRWLDAGSILSDEADQTCRALMSASANWERAQVEGFDGQNPMPSVAQIVGIVEFFTFGRVVQCVDAHVASTSNAMLTALYKQAQSIDRTWKSVQSAADDFLGMGLERSRGFSTIMGYVEVRNAAMHGNGKLTRRQIRDQSVIRKLAEVGVEVDGHQLRLPIDIVNASARSGCAFVTHLDSISWRPG